MARRTYASETTLTEHWATIYDELVSDGDTIASLVRHDNVTGDGVVESSLDASAFATAIASAVTTVAGTIPPYSLDKDYTIQLEDRGEMLIFDPSADRDVTIPTLTTADIGWCCYVINISGSFNINITGFSSADHVPTVAYLTTIIWDGEDFDIISHPGLIKSPA